MSKEIEIKLRVPDFDLARRQLRQAGAVREDRVFEWNALFDTAESQLRCAGSALRMRIEIELAEGESTAVAALHADAHLVAASAGQAAQSRVRTLLTFKGPVETAVMKSREEIETSVEHPGVLRDILHRLGLRERVVYEKIRESWQLGECEVVLDELPSLGLFIEIEGSGVAEIQQARDTLQLGGHEEIRDSYPQMASDFGVATDVRCVQLLFGRS